MDAAFLSGQAYFLSSHTERSTSHTNFNQTDPLPNIPVRDGAASIQLAHVICTTLSQGASMNAITDIGQVYGHNLSHDQAQFVVQSAAAVYCPQYIN